MSKIILQFLFVSGYSGVGKTALINNFKIIKIVFLFLENTINIAKPNQALIEAFNELTNQLLSNESSRENWATKIIEYMGPNVAH